MSLFDVCDPQSDEVIDLHALLAASRRREKNPVARKSNAVANKAERSLRKPSPRRSHSTTMPSMDATAVACSSSHTAAMFWRGQSGHMPAHLEVTQEAFQPTTIRSSDASPYAEVNRMFRPSASKQIPTRDDDGPSLRAGAAGGGVSRSLGSGHGRVELPTVVVRSRSCVGVENERIAMASNPYASDGVLSSEEGGPAGKTNVTSSVSILRSGSPSVNHGAKSGTTGKNRAAFDAQKARLRERVVEARLDRLSLSNAMYDVCKEQTASRLARETSAVMKEERALAQHRSARMWRFQGWNVHPTVEDLRAALAQGGSDGVRQKLTLQRLSTEPSRAHNTSKAFDRREARSSSMAWQKLAKQFEPPINDSPKRKTEASTISPVPHAASPFMATLTNTMTNAERSVRFTPALGDFLSLHSSGRELPSREGNPAHRARHGAMSLDEKSLKSPSWHDSVASLASVERAASVSATQPSHSPVVTPTFHPHHHHHHRAGLTDSLIDQMDNAERVAEEAVQVFHERVKNSNLRSLQVVSQAVMGALDTALEDANEAAVRERLATRRSNNYNKLSTKAKAVSVETAARAEEKAPLTGVAPPALRAIPSPLSFIAEAESESSPLANRFLTTQHTRGAIGTPPASGGTPAARDAAPPHFSTAEDSAAQRRTQPPSTLSDEDLCVSMCRFCVMDPADCGVVNIREVVEWCKQVWHIRPIDESIAMVIAREQSGLVTLESFIFLSHPTIMFNKTLTDRIAALLRPVMTPVSTSSPTKYKGGKRSSSDNSRRLGGSGRRHSIVISSQRYLASSPSRSGRSGSVHESDPSGGEFGAMEASSTLMRTDSDQVGNNIGGVVRNRRKSSIKVVFRDPRWWLPLLSRQEMRELYNIFASCRRNYEPLGVSRKAFETKLRGMETAKGDLRRQFDELDLDGDGILSFEEFIPFAWPAVTAAVAYASSMAAASALWSNSPSPPLDQHNSTSSVGHQPGASAIALRSTGNDALPAATTTATATASVEKRSHPSTPIASASAGLLAAASQANISAKDLMKLLAARPCPVPQAGNHHGLWRTLSFPAMVSMTSSTELLP